MSPLRKLLLRSKSRSVKLVARLEGIVPTNRLVLILSPTSDGILPSSLGIVVRRFREKSTVTNF